MGIQAKQTDRAETDWSTLTGKYFHTLCSGRRIQEQGVILGEVQIGVYVVRNFEWITGSPSFGQRLVSVDRMEAEGWLFYATADGMQEAYEYGGRAHRGGCSCENDS